MPKTMQTKRKTMTVTGAAKGIGAWVTNAGIERALADNDLAPIYARLRSVDSSRDILAYQANRLLVLRDSGPGWADLGSPDRVPGLLARNANQPARLRTTSSSSPQVRALEGVM
ncbi:MAG: hypothetical protein WBE37_21240 [Bryobacteraceae bacterium]